MKAWIWTFTLSFVIARIAGAAPEINLDYIHSVKSGGDTTIYFKGESVQAFRNPAANLSEEDVIRHFTGDALFERNFSDDPTRNDYGLGPVFNNSSCIACHNKDGRGSLPVVPFGQEWTLLRQNESVFLRISIENEKNSAAKTITNTIAKTADNHWGAPVPVPGFSDQLFHLGSMGVREDLPGAGQAQVWMKYEKSSFTYPDGQTIQLKKPVFKISSAYDEYYDSVSDKMRSRLYESDVKTSARVGTPMIGLGLLEAIKESDILALAARDLSPEGIKGQPNYVFDIEKSLKLDTYPISLGRFGLKANTPSVLHQSLGALRGDIGVTNYAFPDESISNTELYKSFAQQVPPRNSLEASAQVSDDLVFYSQTLAVPARRNVSEADVVRGAEFFHQVSCTSCHQPSFVTGSHAISAFSNQKIYPYTDMLLHDMGEGLADGRRDFDANGRQWRTRALWGLGHTQTINPRAGFLHDGRAKTLEEAILWHGGEAEYSKTKFTNLSKEQRSDLIRFLKSL